MGSVLNMRYIPLVLTIGVVSASGALAQTRANSASTSPSGRYVAIGCLSKQGTGAAARYQLTDPRGEKPSVYRLQGDVAQFERHVGHTVEAGGGIAPGPASGPYTMKVESLVYVAPTCSTTAARSGVRP